MARSGVSCGGIPTRGRGVQAPAERRTPKGSFGFLKQSVAGLVGRSEDPSSPHKRHWFGLGARQRSPPCEPEERAAGTSPVPDLEGGDGPGPLAMVHASGTTANSSAVASQLLEGLYGKRLEAKKALDILGTVPEISWLVECYCMTPAQPGWRKSKTAPGDVPLYADEATGKVYEAMPCIRHYMRMAELALTARNLPEKADAAAAQLQHYVQSLQAEVRTTEAAWTGPHEDSESQGHYYHNPHTGISTWENPTYCTSFILSVAEQLQDSDAFPQSDGRRPASNRASKDAPLAPKMPLRSLEDPWTSLEKLEAMNPPKKSKPQDVDVESFLENLSQAQAPQADPSSPSGHSPVQLVATSPSAVRVRDVRSWQPVPRFEANQVALEEVHSPKKEAAAPELHSPTRRVPFRSEGKAGSQGKVDDVREWQPSPTRWDSSSLTREGEGGNSPYRDGRLRQSAEAAGEEACGGPTVSFAPLPPELEADSQSAAVEPAPMPPP